MTRNSIAWLKRYFGTQPPRTIKATTPVFLNNGSPLTRQFAWTIISHYAKKASLKRVTPHTLRHCFATHLLENGASTTEVQLLLGHSHLSTTEIYTHITPRFIRQSYDAHHPRVPGTPKSNRQTQERAADSLSCKQRAPEPGRSGEPTPIRPNENWRIYIPTTNWRSARRRSTLGSEESQHPKRNAMPLGF